MAPVRVRVPAVSVSPPLPPINPPKLPLALVTVNVWLPSTTFVVADDVPERDLMLAPLVVPEMSKMPEPLKTTPEELATAPAPERASVPALMWVAPE